MTGATASPGPVARGPVAVVLKGYPRLSETFIAQELLGLQRRGLAFEIVSLRHPTDRTAHPVHAAISAPVRYLPEYLYQEPLRVLRGWWKARRMPGYRAARATWWRDLLRDPTPNRVRRFGQACVLAGELDPAIRHLYAHFLHTPSSVARYAAVMSGRSWSASAHAKDIWTTPEWEKREKLADAAWAVTCTAVGRDHLAALAPDPGRVELLYHGLDLTDFPPPAERPARDGSDPADPVVIVSVGRAVAKKGYDDLLAALAALPAGLHWRFVHIGGGGLIKALREQAQALGIADRITWSGARPRAAVLAALAAGDLFVLASKIAGDGDRDGLPNVLMEAQAAGLAAVATRVAAIPELIQDGVTGVLVPPGDPPALAAALAAAAGDPVRRRGLGAAGRERVRTAFGHDAGLDRLAARFGLGDSADGAAGLADVA
ncbi:colanic acid biosynthesis glycosyltransferase WcaL [Thalassobaculum fulvum]|uniref:Colanic acid biosynthesis glycosyltransferase WcaL n=1 Tax=Thalassobaculum fulvum TaxID=1633335 RepID=A0A919CMJ6_9PROT|nr:glycosyltransferase [Thalassobaculum fulvum]GHD39362.1 colanic acid biosynthesis glycosyltransferase WcaL [Thalassobaculum fulvum]